VRAARNEMLADSGPAGRSAGNSDRHKCLFVNVCVSVRVLVKIGFFIFTVAKQLDVLPIKHASVHPRTHARTYAYTDANVQSHERKLQLR